jgi:hypothetical protein
MPGGVLPEQFAARRGQVILSEHADGTVTHLYDPPDAQFVVVTRQAMDDLLSGRITSAGPTPRVAHS